MSEEQADTQEVSVEVNPTVGRAAGEICAELLRQYEHMEAVDDEGNPIEASLDGVALMANRLAVIACTGQIPAE